MFNLNFSEALQGGRRSERTKPVSLKEAREHMEQYYESKTPGYVAMAKKRDAEVSKKGKYLLVEGTPESVKYLEEGGVKYYDFLGVDAFDTNTFKMKDNEGVVQTYKTKSIAKTNDGESYSEKFRKEYKKRWKTTNIVNFRWIKEYEKRITTLESRLKKIKGKDARKEVNEQIENLKLKIEVLKNPVNAKQKTSTTEAAASESDSESESESESDDEDVFDLEETKDEDIF
jgi:hypothetical protein